MLDDFSNVPSDCVMFNLRRAARMVSRRYEEALRPVGLRAGQFSILIALSQQPQVPLGALADGLGMERTTLTRNLRPMIRRGLLADSPDRNDARVRLLSLTDEGRALLKRASPLWQKAQEETFDRLPEALWPDTRQRLQALAG